MLNTLAKPLTSKRKDNWIAHYGILLVFLLSLVGSIQDIERNAIIPFIPISFIVILIVFTFLILLLTKIKIKNIKSPLFIGLNIFGIVILSSALYSKYPQLTTTRSLQFIIVTNCLYITLSQIKNTKKLFERVAKISISFSLLASLYGIIIYHYGEFYSSKGIWVSGIQLFGLELSQRMYENRISSFMGNPNPFGLQLMVSILACFYFLKKDNTKYYWNFISIFILFYALTLTGSRASMIGLIGGGVFFINCVYFKDTHGSNSIRALLLAMSLMISAYILVNSEIIKDLFSLMGRASNTLSGREIAWAALVEKLKETPYFGVGYRVSNEAILAYNLIDVSNSHNLYLSILSEIGIIGFMFFGYIYLNPVLKFIFSNIIKIKNLLYISAVFILVSFLINHFF